jgi:hypothetical protein
MEALIMKGFKLLAVALIALSTTLFFDEPAMARGGGFGA